MCMIVMMCASVIATALVIHLSANSKPIPRWVNHIFLEIVPRMICYTDGSREVDDTVSRIADGPSPHEEENNEMEKSDGSHTESDQANEESKNDSDLSKEHREISVILQRLKRDLEEKNSSSYQQHQWRRVSIIIDRLLLYIFSVFTTVCTGLIMSLLIVGSAKDFDAATRHDLEDGEW